LEFQIKCPAINLPADENTFTRKNPPSTTQPF
jgi:hypothetical protein